MDSGKIKGLLLVVCGGVAFYSALQNLGAVAMAVGWLVGILSPFLLGCAIAFVLNVPMRAIERNLFPHARKGRKLRRPLALILTLVAVLGVLPLASSVIGPGITDAVRSIIAVSYTHLPDAMLDVPLQNHLSHFVERRFRRIDLGQDILAGNVLLHHAVDSLDLADNLLQSAMQIVRVHALPHSSHLHTSRGIGIL